MSRRPEITLENAPELYAYYKGRKPNPRTARALHTLFGNIYRPTVASAEGVAETTATHLGAGRNVILAQNHTADDDQFVLASTAYREKYLNGLMGNSVIMAKRGIFTWYLRPTLDSFGTIATIRTRDVSKSRDGEFSEDELKALKERAGDLVIETGISHIDNHRNLAMYPEKTRNKKEPKRIQTVYDGIGRVATGVQRPEELLILPIGVYYGEEESRFRPHVYIGNPLEIPGTVKEVVDMTKVALQSCVDQAVIMSGGQPEPPMALAA
jgi:1-acyl-sn-glycerol-3-phosphate acyltransferase